MLYRKLKDHISVSILGFGAMRLPLIGGTQSPVDSFNPADRSMKKRREEWSSMRSTRESTTLIRLTIITAGKAKSFLERR